MSDLTEQWKKGELPDGMYYMENTSGIIGMVGHCKVFPCYNVKQILARVPSYEKWEKFRNALADNQIENSSLLIENTKLKELLKECRELFDELNYLNMVERITSAIGEKRCHI